MSWKICMLLIGAVIGCSTSSQEEIHHRKLIGSAVSRAIQETGFTPDERFIIEEPPGVPRGIRGRDRSGDRIELYVKRGSVPFSERREWKLQEFMENYVIGVAREQNGRWMATGEVMLIRQMGAMHQASR